MDAPLISKQMIAAESDNLTPEQAAALHIKAARYEASLKRASEDNPAIGANGFMMARMFSEFDGLKADMKETVRNMDDSLRNTAQVMLTNLELCQRTQGARFAGLHKSVKVIGLCVAVLAAVMGVWIAGGDEMAVKVAAIVAKVLL